MKPVILSALLIAGSVFALEANAVAAPAGGTVEMRLQRLEDVEEIRQVLNDYGRTLDARDFDAFGKLFAKDAEYGSALGNPVKGPEAIKSMLENVMKANPSHIGEPNFHLFFNATINVDGDRATARSKGGFAVPSADNKRVDVIILVTYDDVLVREDGHWKFSRRTLHTDLPAPAAK